MAIKSIAAFGAAWLRLREFGRWKPVICPCCNRRFLLSCLWAGAERRGRAAARPRHDKEGGMLKEFQEFISRGNVMD
ncbi:MAG: MscL family protein, partial [Mesorhizobium sp.]